MKNYTSPKYVGIYAAIVVVFVVAEVLLAVQGPKPQQSKRPLSSKALTPHNLSTKSSIQTTTSPTIQNISTWQQFVSANNFFTFKYPTDWSATSVSYGDARDYVINIHPGGKSLSRTASDDFNMSLFVVNNPDSSSPPTRIPYGTVMALSNGIELWTATKSNSVGVRPSTTCPEMELVDPAKRHMSYSLANGKYLTLQAGYCELLNDSPTTSYEQQVNSQDWQTAVQIIDSINPE